MLWEKEKLLVTSNFLFSHVFKNCLLIRQNEYSMEKRAKLFSANSMNSDQSKILWICEEVIYRICHELTVEIKFYSKRVLKNVMK